MAQKTGNCELCGTFTLVANYGFNDEYICVSCSVSDVELMEHVTQEMLKRHGKKKVKDWTDDALGRKNRQIN